MPTRVTVSPPVDRNQSLRLRPSRRRQSQAFHHHLSIHARPSPCSGPQFPLHRHYTQVARNVRSRRRRLRVARSKDLQGDAHVPRLRKTWRHGARIRAQRSPGPDVTLRSKSTSSRSLCCKVETGAPSPPDTLRTSRPFQNKILSAPWALLDLPDYPLILECLRGGILSDWSSGQ